MLCPLAAGTSLTIHYTLYIIHYTLYIIHYTLYIIHYTLYIIHYTLYIIHKSYIINVYQIIPCIHNGVIARIGTRNRPVWGFGCPTGFCWISIYFTEQQIAQTSGVPVFSIWVSTREEYCSSIFFTCNIRCY